MDKNDLENLVTCEECKLILNKSNAKKRLIKDYISILTPPREIEVYYCPKDEPRWLRKVNYDHGGSNYFSEFETNSLGEPYGYSKEVKKK